MVILAQNLAEIAVVIIACQNFSQITTIIESQNLAQITAVIICQSMAMRQFFKNKPIRKRKVSR